MAYIRCGWCLAADMRVEQRDRKLPTTKIFICNYCQHRNAPEELTDQLPTERTPIMLQGSII